MLVGRGCRRSRTAALIVATSTTVAAATFVLACGSEGEPRQQTTVTETRHDRESSAPRTQYLSDIEPLFFTNPVESGSAVINGEAYPRTVSAALDKSSIPAAEVEYDTGRRWKSFDAVIGIRDDSPSECSVQFEVLIDGRSVYSRDISLGNSVGISVRVNDSLRLKLSVSYVGSIEPREYCYAAWGDARLSNQP